MTPIVYEFPDLPSGRTLNGSHGDYRVKARITREVREYALGIIREQRGLRPPAMLARVRLTLDYYLPDRRRKDWLNIVTATKPYEDALTPQRERDGAITPGDIIDDSFAVIQPPVIINWRYRKGRPGFSITITPLGDHECADTPTT